MLETGLIRPGQAGCRASLRSGCPLTIRPTIVAGRGGPVDGACIQALVENLDPIGDLDDVLEVVRDEEDGDSLVSEAFDQVEDAVGAFHREGTRRFVHDDDLRVRQEHPRDGDGWRCPRRSPTSASGSTSIFRSLE